MVERHFIDANPLTVNSGGHASTFMRDPRVRDFIYRTSDELLTFPVEFMPHILTSIVLSVAVNILDNPRDAVEQLMQHMLNTVDEAVVKHRAKMEELKK